MNIVNLAMIMVMFKKGNCGYVNKVKAVFGFCVFRLVLYVSKYGIV